MDKSQKAFGDEGSLHPRSNSVRLSEEEIPCLYCDQAIHQAAGNVRVNGSLVDTRTCRTCREIWVEKFGERWFTNDWHTELLESHRRTFSVHLSELSETVVETNIEPVLLLKGKPRRKKAVKPRVGSEFTVVFLAVRDILIISQALQARDAEGAPVLFAGIDPAVLKRFQRSEEGQILLGKQLGIARIRQLLELRGFNSHVVNTTQPQIASTGLRRDIQRSLKNVNAAVGCLVIPSDSTLQRYIRVAEAELAYTPPAIEEVQQGMVLFLTKKHQRFAVADALSL